MLLSYGLKYNNNFFFNQIIQIDLKSNINTAKELLKSSATSMTMKRQIFGSSDVFEMPGDKLDFKSLESNGSNVTSDSKVQKSE